MLPVSYDDVLAAMPRVHSVLKPTPLYAWPELGQLVGCEFWLKHENHHRVGAFKVRGGVNLVSLLSKEDRAAGIYGASSGNHGQSLAFAARHFGVRCTVAVPRQCNPGKKQAILDLGAELVEVGRDFDEAREHVEELARERGGRYVHSANEPHLIAGVGTYACEIFDELADPDVILVPIGLGSGVCGTCLVAKARRPETQVIGVQAQGAAAMAQSWRAGMRQPTTEAATWAEGLATRVPADMTLTIMRELMDDVILVSDDALREAVYLILKHAHQLAEGAGAAALAAALAHRERFAGRRVVGILSGGNLDMARLPKILSAAQAAGLD